MQRVDVGQFAPELYFPIDTLVINVGQFQVPFRCNHCLVGSCDLCVEDPRIKRAVLRGGIGEKSQQLAVKRERAEPSVLEIVYGVIRAGVAPRVVFVERQVVRVVGREPNAVQAFRNRGWFGCSRGFGGGIWNRGGRRGRFCN